MMPSNPYSQMIPILRMFWQERKRVFGTSSMENRLLYDWTVIKSVHVRSSPSKSIVIFLFVFSISLSPFFRIRLNMYDVKPTFILIIGSSYNFLFSVTHLQKISDFRSMHTQCAHTYKSKRIVAENYFDHVGNNINSWEMDIIAKSRKAYTRKKMCYRSGAAAKGWIQ